MVRAARTRNRGGSCPHPGCPSASHNLDTALVANGDDPTPDPTPAIVEPMGPTQATQDFNQKVKNDLNFDDKADFDQANKGFIDTDNPLTIKNENGDIVWDLEEYKTFISDDADADAPDSVNPSLYRNAKLCMINGLFEVIDGIYQVRGYDLSNITFVRGKTGWIVFDPLISAECAKATLDLVNRNLGARPVVAVIYSHSHIDHYGGAHGVISEEDAKTGKVTVLASEGFVEHAVSENVIAGIVMARRSIYMYGALLPRNATGGVNSGLGQTTSTGSSGLIVPNDIIKETGELRTYDGVNMIFQFTPGTEAPTEMNTYFPDMEALWMAENTTCTMHNILTLRGALVRDALKWASYLTESIELWGKKSVVKFQAHHWPLWGRAKIYEYLKKQRDMYKFIHDQSVRLMNKGLIGSEISEQLQLPDALDKTWNCRGYYGTLSHNSRAVYQRYMGWYNGNPSDLNNLPPEEAAKRYIDYMGGEDAVIAKAQADFNCCDINKNPNNYRWVAEVLKHVVFANPDSVDGKSLLASTLEQMRYQAESGAWRAEYLQGAYELRNGIPSSGGTETASADTIKNLEPGMLFDYLGVCLNQDKAAGKLFSITIVFKDLSEMYRLKVENSVLTYSDNAEGPSDVTVITSKIVLNQIMVGNLDVQDAIAANLVSIAGNEDTLTDFTDMIDKFEMWFNIVTP